MSVQFRFQISKKQLVINSLFSLIGVILAALFLRFSSAELLSTFFTKTEGYFQFLDYKRIFGLILQECLWLLLIMFFSKIPYGKFALILVLFYKGFSIGVIASVFSAQFGKIALKYIVLLLLPQSILYVISLCIATQISTEISENTILKGRHTKIIPTDRRAYIICFIITILAATIETLVVPWTYQQLF